MNTDHSALDDAQTARMRAELLNSRRESPVMSIDSERRLRAALQTGDHAAVIEAQNAGKERHEAENRAIARMPGADLRAVVEASQEGSYAKAARLIDAAVIRDEPPPQAARTEPVLGLGANTIEPTPETQRVAPARAGADKESVQEAPQLQGRDDGRAATATPRLDDRHTTSDLSPTLASDTAPGYKAHPPLEDRFNVTGKLTSKLYEFRDQPGKTAFVESLAKLSTTVDNPSAVRGMVDRALERGWHTVQVQGSPEFRRQAWVAASARGLGVVGYTPTAGDRETSQRERERLSVDARQTQRAARPQAQGMEQAPGSTMKERSGATVGASSRERQVLQALEKAIREGKVPSALREALRERVVAESTRRASQGQRLGVRVYDPKAPRPRAAVPDFKLQRSGDRDRSR